MGHGITERTGKTGVLPQLLLVARSPSCPTHLTGDHLGTNSVPENPPSTIRCWSKPATAAPCSQVSSRGLAPCSTISRAPSLITNRFPLPVRSLMTTAMNAVNSMSSVIHDRVGSTRSYNVHRCTVGAIRVSGSTSSRPEQTSAIGAFEWVAAAPTPKSSGPVCRSWGIGDSSSVACRPELGLHRLHRCPSTSAGVVVCAARGAWTSR